MQLPVINLVVIQPSGYVHSLGFLDQARYFRYQFQRLGAEVTICKNRLREDAVNFVFGAHLGFCAEWLQRHACIFVNLEQLGAGGAALPSDYLELLRCSAVVDYDAANVAVYSRDPDQVPLVPFLHAPYLDGSTAPDLASRPIDLLFFGSINERRRAFIERVEACGVQVTMFDHPLYGPERDAYVLHSKAVLSCHFYESSRFEQARAFHALSLGTPVIAERTMKTAAPKAFDDAVFWLDDRSLEEFFRREFRSVAFAATASDKLAAFRRQDAGDSYAELLAFAGGFARGFARNGPIGTWRPRRMNLGSGRDYRAGWLNVDVLERAQPDLVLDLAKPLALPLTLPTFAGGQVALEAGAFDRVHASNVLEHVPDLPALMGNLLALLAEGGELEIEVPYERAPTAWQDPTHVRAMNENSWLYYTEWFWYLGWFEHRFEMASSQWLDAQLRPSQRGDAAFMRVTLKKIRVSPHERLIARAMRPDFGGIPEDTVFTSAASADGASPAPSDEEVDAAELSRRIHAMLGKPLASATALQP